MTQFLRSPAAQLALALVLACLIAALVLPGYAAAGEASVSGAVLTLPIGDYAVEAAKLALSLLVPSLVGWIGVEVTRLFPAWRKQFTDDRIDRMVRLAGDFALAALEGCAKGRTVPVSLGSAAIATAAKRALDSSPAWQVAAAGGVQGIAEKVFRDLPLDPAATAANTLHPALEQLGVKAA